MFKLSQRSIKKLQGVNPFLVQVVNLAIKESHIDFGISEGLRDQERQAYLFETGKSKTLKSRHLVGDAVDVYAWVNGRVSWDMKHYEQIAFAFYLSADKLGHSITWGGSWASLLDGPHFQIEKKAKLAMRTVT